MLLGSAYVGIAGTVPCIVCCVQMETPYIENAPQRNEQQAVTSFDWSIMVQLVVWSMYGASWPALHDRPPPPHTHTHNITTNVACGLRADAG
jgi:hypothetical protein